MLYRDELKKPKLALKDLNTLVRKYPNEVDYIHWRGVLYDDYLHDYKSAFIDFKKCIKMRPKYHNTYNRCAIILENLKKYELVLEYYNKAIKLKPNDSNYYYNRGTFYEGCLQNYNAALRDLSKAIKLNPNDYESYERRGKLYLNVFKKRSLALEDFKMSIKLNPKPKPLVYHIREGDVKLQVLTKN